MFHFFVIDRTQKQTLLDMQQISFAVLSRPSLSQMYNLQRLKMKSNISWVTWYALNFKIIAFFLSGLSQGGALKM